MIIKLIPEQITDLWDSIRYGIIHAVAPLVDPTPDNIQDILCQLLRQDMQCWCVYEEGDKDKNIQGYIITSISIDINTKFRSLVIYSVFLYAKVDTETWADGMNLVERFALANDCTRIVAYTNNPTILSIAEKGGYNTDYTYLVKELGG